MRVDKTIKSSFAACARVRCLIFVLCLLPRLTVAEVISGLVIGINDGDTVKILDESQQVRTIRLLGVDAPEKAQAFGEKSKQSLSNLIYKQRVFVQWSKRDKYGRTVGKVVTQDGVDVCLEQITLGMAWHYKQYAGDQSTDDREKYANAEKVARESKTGLWQDEAPDPPWIWRHRYPPPRGYEPHSLWTSCTRAVSIVA